MVRALMMGSSALSAYGSWMSENMRVVLIASPLPDYNIVGQKWKVV